PPRRSRWPLRATTPRPRRPTAPPRPRAPPRSRAPAPGARWLPRPPPRAPRRPAGRGRPRPPPTTPCRECTCRGSPACKCGPRAATRAAGASRPRPAAVRRDARGAYRAPRASPLDGGSQRGNERPALEQQPHETDICLRCARVAEGGRLVGMPEAYPETIDLLRSLSELDSVCDPDFGVLDPAVLRQGAVHPHERNLVESPGCLVGGVPGRHYVGDAEAEAVAIG